MGLGRVFFHVLWHDCWHVPLWDTNYSWYSWRFLVHVTSYHHRKIQIHGFQHGICCHDTCPRGDALETLLQRSRRHFTVGSAPACEGSTTLTDVKQSKHLNAGIFDMLLTVICLSLCPSYIYIYGIVTKYDELQKESLPNISKTVLGFKPHRAQWVLCYAWPVHGRC